MARQAALLLLVSATVLLPTPTLAESTGGTGPATAPPGRPATGGSAGMNEREEEMLQRIRELKAPRWRRFGACDYDWSAWRLSDGGVRSTVRRCGDPAVTAGVAVHCRSLKITPRGADGAWEAWRLPWAEEESSTFGGEDRMVATLCANLATPPSGPPALPRPKPPPLPAAGAAP